MSDMLLPQVARSHTPSEMIPGIAAAFAVAAGAMVLRRLTGISVLSPMLVAILVGIGLRLLLGPTALPKPGLNFVARPVLRAGIVLLAFQITIADITSLGAGVFVVAATTLGATYVAVLVIGRALGLPLALCQLIGAGTAVCGASAVVAANSVARSTEEDVGYAIAGVTLFGTLLMLILPIIAIKAELSSWTYGIWTGASIHEVAQVAAASFQLGDEAGQIGTFTKLIRVMLLAPLVIAMAFSARRRGGASPADRSVGFPWFVMWFIALIGINSVIDLPSTVITASGGISTLLMTAGLAAMGLSIDLRRLRQRGVAPLVLCAFGTIFIAIFSLSLIMVLNRIF